MGEQVGYDEVDYFCEVFGADQIDNFHLAYQGNYNQFEDFAKELFMSSHQIPEEIEFYIDWEKVSRDIGYDYYYDKKTGAVFSDI